MAVFVAGVAVVLRGVFLAMRRNGRLRGRGLPVGAGFQAACLALVGVMTAGTL